MDTTLPQLHDLTEARLAVLRQLADSLEASQFALLRNDAEMIVRGAAHQAELCARWNRLEAQLRRAHERSRASTGTSSPHDEWSKLSARIRHLTRVHSSLLRHLNRSLAILAHVAASCGPTYVQDASLLVRETQARAGD
ncbi:MAG TPA: hypothetical protein VLT90_16925 [Terriglobales bacterium]|nr:hypothetical protein [Terriglobales bacterium]